MTIMVKGELVGGNGFAGSLGYGDVVMGGRG
jgi:hypothetical protein